MIFNNFEKYKFNGTEVVGLKTTIAVDKIFGKSVELKWPNDLIYKSKKVGGILIESENFEDRFLTIVGIGLNLKVKPAEAHWGDLDEELDNEEKKLIFTKELAHQVAQLENFSDKNWTKDWVAKCIHIDKKIKIPANKEEFLFIGINENGAALLKNTNGDVISPSERGIQYTVPVIHQWDRHADLLKHVFEKFNLVSEGVSMRTFSSHLLQGGFSAKASKKSRGS